MDIQSLSNKIKEVLDLMDKGRHLLKMALENKIKAEEVYNVILAKTIVKLTNGVEYDLGDGAIVVNPKAHVKEIANAICRKEKADVDISREMLKINYEKLKILQAELSGYQTLYKHQSQI